MLAITVVTGSPAVAAAEGDLASTVVVVVSTTTTHRLVTKQACDAPVSPQPLFKATKPGSVDLESLNGGLGGSYTVFDVADGARAGVFKVGDGFLRCDPYPSSFFFCFLALVVVVLDRSRSRSYPFWFLHACMDACMPHRATPC